MDQDTDYFNVVHTDPVRKNESSQVPSLWEEGGVRAASHLGRVPITSAWVVSVFSSWKAWWLGDTMESHPRLPQCRLRARI